MGSRVGMEVPITGSDQLKWIEVSIPSSSSSSLPSLPPIAATYTETDEDSSSSSRNTFAPFTEDCASCHIIGDPSTYLIWRIHKSLPNALEVMELTACNEVPRIGLRLIFPDALSPFAFVCKDETSNSIRNPYLLYTLTVSGVAYLFKLRSVSEYASCSIFPQNEFIEFNLQTLSQSAPITAVTATSGCLVIGRHDASVACFQLGVLNTSAQGFMHELRDDVGISRLWGLMARGRTVAPVQDIVIAELHGRKLIFVVHMDGSLRIWDLLSHTKLLSDTISFATSTGCIVSRLWVGEFNQDTCLVSLAVLCTSTEVDMETIAIFSLRFYFGEKVTLLPESMQMIPLEEGMLIDLIITTKKLWILKEDGLVSYDFSDDKFNLEDAQSYCLQEDLVADQLFQSAEHSLDGLSWTSLSLSSVKDQIVPFVSSIFLRRLLQPGIYQNATLRATAHNYNKLWSDSEFQSLTVDGLKKEIFSLIEGEVVVPMSIIYCWKKFCRQYFHYWCKNNALYGLLVDPSTGAIGLIRKKTISLFRCLEGIELLIYGSFDEFGDFANSGLNLPNDFLDREILFEVLRCISNIHQQLGKAGSAIFYESLVNAQLLSSEEVVPGFLKILETGYSSSAAKLHVSQFGADTAWKKELEDHRNQRKFSIDMLLSLHALLDKAASWDRVLNVIVHFLKFLVPHKRSQSLDAEAVFNINSSALILATSQVARVMFESSFDILLLLGYLVNVRGQIHMMYNDISRIQLELMPMIQETLTEWVILHFLGTTPSESPPLEDFSTRLSSLHIDSSTIRRSWNEKLGTCDFTLACLLFLSSQNSSEDLVFFNSRSFPGLKEIISTVQNFSSWVFWGWNRPIELGMILLRHGQYEAVENLFGVIDAHSRKERTSKSAQDGNGDWCKYLHLLGFCLLARAHCELHGVVKERKVREAVRCFFRASSGLRASQALQSLSFKGLPHLGYTSGGSEAEWKLHYYQWAMQICEQYNLSEGACQFALAALEQVDEILGSKYDKCGGDLLNESATTVRGRLWANVFKFTLDLNHYNDAYCAIISNPDEDSKHICLRRFVIVLCERGAYKTLCDGQLPFVGLTEKMEQELAWKAERSDVVAKPNPYKLLYAFEMHRHNWRRAATYMYRYSVRLRTEMAFKEHQHRSMALQEILNGLSAAINALNLVHPDYAWIDPQMDGYSCLDDVYPNKKARKVGEESSQSDYSVKSWRLQYCVDCEKLEQEYVQTSAEYSLSLANVKPIDKGNQANPSGLVDLLVQTNLYDMTFTVLLKFWKGSELKRELERVFVAIALKCCPISGVSSMSTHGLLLTASEEESCINSAMETSPSVHQSKGNSQWETLEQYLGKYMKLHPRLPVIVAETLLHTDPQMELPLWLVLMFKGGRRATSWGMAGLEANPGSLFSLYVDYGRFTEATNLLLEYMESFASLRPADIMNRKKMSAIWFPYTTIERLWCQLEETKSSGHMIDQCDQLKRILHGALHSHLKLIEVDSHDAVSSAA